MDLIPPVLDRLHPRHLAALLADEIGLHCEVLVITYVTLRAVCHGPSRGRKGQRARVACEGVHMKIRPDRAPNALNLNEDPV